MGEKWHHSLHSYQFLLRSCSTKVWNTSISKSILSKTVLGEMLNEQHYFPANKLWKIFPYICSYIWLLNFLYSSYLASISIFPVVHSWLLLVTWDVVKLPCSPLFLVRQKSYPEKCMSKWVFAILDFFIRFVFFFLNLFCFVLFAFNLFRTVCLFVFLLAVVIVVVDFVYVVLFLNSVHWSYFSIPGECVKNLHFSHAKIDGQW